MKNIFLTLALVAGLITTSFFQPNSASGGLMSDITVGYDFVKTIHTIGKGNRLTTEFDLEITANDLGLTKFKTYGYCVEYNQSVNRGTFKYELNFLTEVNLDRFYYAAWLLDEYAPGKGISLSTDEQRRAAALQGLVWETITTDSDFAVVDDDSAIGDYYKSFAADLSAFSLNDTKKTYLNANYMIATSADVQDFIVKVPHSDPVPEPATMMLFGAGILGLAGTRFRRKK